MIKLLVNTPNDLGTTVLEATQEAKNLFKENNKPFILKDGVDGPDTRVVFTEHFIMVLRDADSNECLAKMSQLEKELYWDYINYQSIVNSIMFSNPTWDDAQIDAEAKIQYEAGEVYIASEFVVRTLSDWAYAETLKFDKDSCYDTMHVWEAY
jgi:hypothetical protein